MNTEIVPLSEEIKSITNLPGLNIMKKMRSTPLKDWFNDEDLAGRLSGTLKKNNRVGFKVFDQLRHEAFCQTLGWTWESYQSSYITFNDAVSEGDCHAITEAGWFADRWLALNLFPEDKYELKYIIITMPDDAKREGVGLICRETSIQWIQPGSLVFCMLCEYSSKTKTWTEASNPF